MKDFLGRTSVLVHPGGAGTCAQAIRAGVPQLLVPTVVDHFDNALQMEALGVGVQVPMKEYGEELVAKKLTDLLGAESVRRACSLYASRYAVGNALEKTCSYIEAMA